MSSTTTPQNQFKLNTILVPETEEETNLNRLITPEFAPQPRPAVAPEFSDENISRISEQLQKAAEPRQQREKARLANLLSGTDSLQGTPLAISRSLLASEQEARISGQEADLFREQQQQQAIDRRAEEQREFVSGESQLGRDLQLDKINLQREFNLDDRAFDENARKVDRVFALIESGQIDKTSEQAIEILRQFGIDDPSKFLSRNEAEARAAAEAQGLTVEEAEILKRSIGEAFFKDVQENPERYADLAVDPVEELRQERINALLAAGVDTKDIPKKLRELEDADALGPVTREELEDILTKGTRV